MALYSKGDKVIRISTNDKGIIVGIGPCGRGGRQLYKVNYNGVETDELEGNLMADCNMDDPFERCRNNVYGSYIEFSKINTTFKIQNSNISTISSLKASKTLFRPYQFKPLLKFLNSDKVQRIQTSRYHCRYMFVQFRFFRRLQRDLQIHSHLCRRRFSAKKFVQQLPTAYFGPFPADCAFIFMKLRKDHA